MNVIIAFESSGTVREAFRSRGHNAWSLDILPPDDGSPHHIQRDWYDYLEHYLQDVADGISAPWDLLIAHPPCTHLSVSGARHWPAKQADGRQQAAIDMFMSCVDFPAIMSAIENPVGIMSRIYRKPDQYIQPYQFGHPESKKTGLWLKNLPALTPTNVIEPPLLGCSHCKITWEWDVHQRVCPKCRSVLAPAKPLYLNQTPSGQNKLGPSPDRWKLRSKTYDGIAQAMADQWTTGHTNWRNA
jgi:hypothetical protein